MSDLASLHYTGTCSLCLLVEQKTKHRVVFCSICRRELLRAAPPVAGSRSWTSCLHFGWSAEDLFSKCLFQCKFKYMFQLWEAHPTETIEKHFLYFTARVQSSFILDVTFSASSTSFHHSCVFLRPSSSSAVLYFVRILCAKASVHKSRRMMFVL